VGLWLGATPELLMTLKRNQLSTVSLAGTLSASDPNPWSDKERHEQQLVTDYIISELEALSQQVEADPVREIRAGHLRHLKSEVRALIQPENMRLKDLILRLHPTPAVCGFPKDLAREFIFKNENYQRRFYTGFLGEINALREVSRTSSKRNTENKAFKSLFKETELFVNLRCMNLDNGQANVYVGGGVVQNSQPEIEWSETVEKSNTMISVL
jgi:isochorismate synthase